MQIQAKRLPNIHIAEILHTRKYLTFATTTGDTKLRNSSVRPSRIAAATQNWSSATCHLHAQQRVSGDSSFGGSLVTCRLERVKLARAPSAPSTCAAFISCYLTRPLRGARLVVLVGGGEKSALGPARRFAARRYIHLHHAETKYIINLYRRGPLSMHLCLVCVRLRRRPVLSIRVIFVPIAVSCLCHLQLFNSTQHSSQRTQIFLVSVV